MTISSKLKRSQMWLALLAVSALVTLITDHGGVVDCRARRFHMISPRAMAGIDLQNEPPAPSSSQPSSPPSSSPSPLKGEARMAQFDCSNMPTGPNKDPLYCDIFHACVHGVRKKTYMCPQLGARFYYDSVAQRCLPTDAPAAANTTATSTRCPTNLYYQPLVVEETWTPPSVETWRAYVRYSDPFSCLGRADGFYPSYWCNVFYRCVGQMRYEFLCARQTSGERLWWSDHSRTPTGPTTDATAHCDFPCAIGRPCTSIGGVLREDLIPVASSPTDATSMFAPCTGSSNSNTDNSNNVFHLLQQKQDTPVLIGRLNDGQDTDKQSKTNHAKIANYTQTNAPVDGNSSELEWK